MSEVAQKYYNIANTPSNMPKKPVKVSSRLAQAESKRAMKQTILFSIASVILLLVFLFVVLPGLIRLISSGGDVTQVVSTDSIPPQVPTISAPVEATHSATIKVEGYGEPDSEVVLLLNGGEMGRATISGDEGRFEMEVNLEEGENVVEFYAIDQAKNESALSRQYTIVYDNQPPGLELETPEDGQSFELRKNQNITIKGKTEPRAYVYINSRRVLANAEGSFSSSYRLEEGENKILLRIEDLAGNSSEHEITVHFRF